MILATGDRVQESLHCALSLADQSPTLRDLRAANFANVLSAPAVSSHSMSRISLKGLIMGVFFNDALSAASFE